MIVQIYETQSCEQAKALIQVGVDHIGVLVGKGDYSREFSPEQAKEILSCVAEQAKKVVLSLSGNLNDIVEIVNIAGPDILHLGVVPESLLPKDVQNLKGQFPDLEIMRTIPVKDEGSVELAKQYDGVADYLLLDTWKKGSAEIGATGETHDWGYSKKIVDSVNIPVVLAGGLGPGNVAEAVELVKPYGVDSKTKTDKKGSHEKDIEKVKEFVKFAKAVK